MIELIAPDHAKIDEQWKQGRFVYDLPCKSVHMGCVVRVERGIPASAVVWMELPRLTFEGQVDTEGNAVASDALTVEVEITEKAYTYVRDLKVDAEVRFEIVGLDPIARKIYGRPRRGAGSMTAEKCEQCGERVELTIGYDALGRHFLAGRCESGHERRERPLSGGPDKYGNPRDAMFHAELSIASGKVDGRESFRYLEERFGVDLALRIWEGKRG